MNYTLEERKKKCFELRKKFPDRIPVIIEKSEKSKLKPFDGVKKFLIPGDITTSGILYIIRKRLNLDSKEALFIFINNELPPANMIVKQLYDRYCKNGDIMFITYCEENTFGDHE
jgi:GABA(A) receptor-associated protein